MAENNDSERPGAELEQRYNNIAGAVKPVVREWIYYIFAAVIVIAIVFTQLNAFTLRVVDWQSLIADTVPLFVATILLDRTFYANGKAKGKGTKKFAAALTAYSDRVNGLTGDQLDALPEWCDELNRLTLRNKQKAMLYPAVVSIEAFDDGVDGAPPIKTMTNKEIKRKFGAERAGHIIAAKRASIRRLTPERLMSEQQTHDVTDTGHTEQQNTNIQTRKRVLSYAATTLVFAVVATRDIMQWGWTGLGMLLLKIAFAVGGSILSQINGYNDITMALVDHYARKTDLLKQFESWYSARN